MVAVTFDSDSLEVTEQFLNRHYTTMQIGNRSESAPARSRVTRDTLGPVSLDRLELGFDMTYDADALNKICLCGVESGWIEEHYLDTGTDCFTAGEIGLLTPPELPYRGVVHHAHYTITMFDPGELSRVADTEPRHDRAPVELIGHRPISPAAGRSLMATLAHLRELATAQPMGLSPLVAATASQYLAATVLATFPNTACTEPTAGDRHDAHPGTLRRALAHMESHVHEDISVGEIAAAAYVTVRALQLTFRRHLGTTPMAYLKRMRLRGAHDHLIAASPEATTVAAVAAAWGFGHPGRFATLYRRHYGRPPAVTLGS